MQLEIHFISRHKNTMYSQTHETFYHYLNVITRYD